MSTSALYYPSLCGRSPAAAQTLSFRPLFPLDEFYTCDGLPLPAVAVLRGEEVPEPYRQLLVHERDMTPTLEAFHGERIHLRVLARRVEGGALWRQVALTLNDSGRPVEYGAIVIYYERFPAGARELILESRQPLGTILADYAIAHDSCPQAFLRVEADAAICGALRVERQQPLYGRRNILHDAAGAALAEILELLPTAAEPTSGVSGISQGRLNRSKGRWL